LGWALNERSSSERERRELKRRRSDFQRTTILDLQETLANLARATSRIHHEDWMAFKKSGQWGRNQTTDEWAEKQRDAFQSLTVFTTRLDDEELRRELQRYQDVCYEATMANDESTSNLALIDLQIAFNAVMGNLGETLRRLP
jgi:16S rRNA C967 or C1407 C5-methylase (RsmB/RsmF family)